MQESINQSKTLLMHQLTSHFKIPFGDTEIVIVSDGLVDLGGITNLFRTVSEREIKQLLRSNFLPTNRLIVEENILLFRSGGKKILFDSGLGMNQMFGPHAGRLQFSLLQAGIDPNSIDAVVCSHAHLDHIGGISTDDGFPLFPNAEIYINETDFQFWTDQSLVGTDLGTFVTIARNNLLPVRDRIVFFRDGQEFLPGVQAMLTSGHSVGHTSFLLTSKNQSLYLIGDLAHHHVLVLGLARAQIIYDQDPEKAAETRVKVFDMLSAERMEVFGYHFPWPGFGHVAKENDGYRYYPELARWVNR